MFTAWICGFIVGAVVMAYYHYIKTHDPHIVIQADAKATGDIVGRDKTTKQYPFGGQ